MKVDICSRSEHEPHSWHLWNATDGFFSRSDGCRQNMWAIATNYRHEQWENWGNRRFLWFNALHQSRCNWNIIQLLLDGSDCWLNYFLPRSDEMAGEETLPSDEDYYVSEVRIWLFKEENKSLIYAGSQCETSPMWRGHFFFSGNGWCKAFW